MFYLQFVPKALAPVDYRFRDIDQIPRTSSRKFLGRVLADALPGAFADVTTAPYRAYQAQRRKFREYRAFSKEITKPYDYADADAYGGVRIGVREFWAEKRMQTNIQDLDTGKCTQIVERLMLELSGNNGNLNVNAGSGTQYVQVNSDPRAAALEQIDQVVAKLLAALPPASIGAAAGDVALVNHGAHAASPDPAALSQALQRLAAAIGQAPQTTALSGRLADGVGRLMR